MKTISIQGNVYEITDYADDGLPIIKAKAVSTQDGFDEDGNPKISVNITVPPVSLLGEPGKNG